MDPMKELLAQVDDLPTLPDVYVRIADALGAAECDLRKVGEMIALDPVLVGRLIRIANSALFSSAGRADSIVDAIVRLGARETRNVVITAAVLQVLDPKASEINLRDFWTLGLASGVEARPGHAVFQSRDDAHQLAPARAVRGSWRISEYGSV